MSLRLHGAHLQCGQGLRGLTRQELDALLRGEVSADVVADREAEVQWRSDAVAVGTEERCIQLLLAEARHVVDSRTGATLIVVEETSGQQKVLAPAAEAPRCPKPPTEGSPRRPPAFLRRLQTFADAVMTRRSHWVFTVSEDGVDVECAVALAFQRLRARGAVVSDGASTSMRLAQKSIGDGSYASIHIGSLAGRGGAKEEVAVKVYKRCQGEEVDEEVMCKVDEEVRKEVAILIAVQGHPNVLRFRGLFRKEASDAEGTPGPRGLCLAMERCSGGDVHKLLLERRVGLGENHARSIMTGLLGALEHVHELGILHRDVKPANILIRSDASIALADFGLSCSEADLTQTMRCCGTPGYIAPEVIEKKGWRRESDMFSAGAVLYALLSSKLPFAGRDVAMTLARTLRSELRFDHVPFTYVSKASQTLAAALLDKDFTGRPTAMAALDDDWFACCTAKGSPSSKVASEGTLRVLGGTFSSGSTRSPSKNSQGPIEDVSDEDAVAQAPVAMPTFAQNSGDFDDATRVRPPSEAPGRRLSSALAFVRSRLPRPRSCTPSRTGRRVSG